MFNAMSDRDKKLILILLIAVVIFCPYYFLIKVKNEDTANLKADNENLEERLAYLQELNTHREDYEKETAKFKKDTDAIVERYPSDIKPENYAMFLLNTERYEDGLGNALVFDAITFGDNVTSAIGTEEVNTGYSYSINESEVSFQCFYDGLKDVLAYLDDYKDPMTFSTLSVDYNDNTGQISGSMTIDQYAIQGEDTKELPKVVIDPSLDDSEHPMRGVIEGISVFGPIKDAVLVPEEDAEAADADAEETAEEE